MLLRSIPHVQCLKYHEITGSYDLASRKCAARSKPSLTARSRCPCHRPEIAERNLREWLDVLDQPSAETGFTEDLDGVYLIKRGSNQKSSGLPIDSLEKSACAGSSRKLLSLGIITLGTRSTGEALERSHSSPLILVETGAG